jgi:hypothetical protein
MSARIRSLAMAAAVVFGIATGAAAQSNPIQGVVHDATGTPVPGVVVTISHPQQATVRVVLTDLQGRYVVNELDPRTQYDVQVSHPKFRKTRVKAGAGDEINVTLKPRRSCRPAARQAAAVARQ